MEFMLIGVGVLFVKYSVVIVGFVGVIFFLLFLCGFICKQVGVVVVIGFLLLIFIIQFVVVYFGFFNDVELKNGVVFLIGLFVMNIIFVVKVVVECIFVIKGV